MSQFQIGTVCGIYLNGLLTYLIDPYLIDFDHSFHTNRAIRPFRGGHMNFQKCLELVTETDDMDSEVDIGDML